MVCSLHSVTTGSRDRANVSLIIIVDNLEKFPENLDGVQTCGISATRIKRHNNLSSMTMADKRECGQFLEQISYVWSALPQTIRHARGCFSFDFRLRIEKSSINSGNLAHPLQQHDKQRYW